MQLNVGGATETELTGHEDAETVRETAEPEQRESGGCYIPHHYCPFTAQRRSHPIFSERMEKERGRGTEREREREGIRGAPTRARILATDTKALDN